MKIFTICFFLLLSAGAIKAQCSSSEVNIRVEVTTDDWGYETSWTLTDLAGTVILQGGQDIYESNTLYLDSICVDAGGCFFFEIYDSFGDGIYAPNGYKLYVDDTLVASGANDIGSYAKVTAFCPEACNMTTNALQDFDDHIKGIETLSNDELALVRNVFSLFPECLAENDSVIVLGKSVMEYYESQIGALFTTPNTEDGFSRDPASDPGLETERAMLALQQGIFDKVFTSEVYADYPHFIRGWKFSSCYNFPGYVDPPADSTLRISTLIRANFADPDGSNPYFNINGDGTDHALRPTGLYLAPGSVATISVPESLVGKDYYVRVGSHEWDLSNRPFYRRMDRISKKFPIDSTTIHVFNPMGGAISILVPYGAAEGIVEVSVQNGVESPFFSLKSFYETPDFDAELNKPGPWAVFETDNVMFTVPSHSIIPGQNDLMQSLLDWDKALQGANSILAREIIPDKHNMYMIADVNIRFGAYSIGYPMSNDPLDYTNVPGPAYFMDGPGPNDETNFHESGHAWAISKFPGEVEAIVNFPYIMAMNYGLGVDLNEAVRYSFVPNTFDIDKTATHRMVSNTFGTERDISNTTTDEVRYQHRGYGHYFEIVNLFGWCPLRNFWKQEYIDFENGIDHGVNDQDIDSRIVRLCIATQADLRPLFHVFGILPQDSIAVEDSLHQYGIEPSYAVYDRMQDYLNMIPEDNAAFVDYALSVYPNLYTDGPNDDPNYGVGWHYLKSLTYDNAEAQTRTNLLQGIIDLYFPDGEPVGQEPIDVCCTLDTISLNLVNEEWIVTGGVEPFVITLDTINGIQTVTVTDFDNCVASAETLISLAQESFHHEMNVFPNPTFGDIMIDLGTYTGTAGLSVIDLQGRVIHTVSDVTEPLVPCPLPATSGVYLLRITFSEYAAACVRVVKL